MSREVFVSYRRDDASSEAGRVADAIRNRFGRDSVFHDTSDIRFGEKWPELVRAAIESAAVMVVVIGPEWILARDEYGRRRVDDPDDWVRREIQLALERDKTIMPLLVRHARMTPPDALPPEMAPLSARQAFGIRGESWSHDLQLVLEHLELHVHRRGTAEAVPDGTTRAPALMLTADDFRAVALGFGSGDMEVRNAAAAEIKEIAAFLELEEVLTFCRSGKTAERVGAAIALGVHVRSSKRARQDRRVLAALGELLTDGQSSLIRYRAALVLRSSPALVPTYADDLRHLAEKDENSYFATSLRGCCSTASGRGGPPDRATHTKARLVDGARPEHPFATASRSRCSSGQ